MGLSARQLPKSLRKKREIPKSLKSRNETILSPSREIQQILVNDWYSSDYYELSPEINPTGPQNGVQKSSRGGSHGTSPNYLRTAVRGYIMPIYSNALSIGFRCALSAPTL